MPTLWERVRLRPCPCQFAILDRKITVFRFRHLGGREEQAGPDGRIGARLDQDEGAGQPVRSVAVKDEGAGMSAAEIERMFDPYFTTKEMGSTKGQGLGLSICYSIVRSHGGFITAESKPGFGTTIYVYLPAHTVARGNGSTEVVAGQPAWPGT